MTPRSLRDGLLAAALALIAVAGHAQNAAKPEPLKSGLEFTGPEVRELQRDDFANPGMLWITRGERLWQEPAGAAGKSCAAWRRAIRSSMPRARA